ncbi:receptor-like serine/threonine-protein kinase SD1-8 [Iris pallida]|uniref:Receptor-like serine/threonine-protein kinase n=1 Tax=Iris pallida TaxID=29817 RepID=A0AAX6HN15_IRIPA|nr:receptor-like serine/threonine-protein kinase SD1-8 [Iris pallida]
MVTRRTSFCSSMKPLPLRNISILLIILATFTTPSRARDTITPTQPLADNDTLISSGGDFALGFFTPAGTNNRYLGLWYHKISEQTIVWVANRDEPIVGSTGRLSITPGGVLAVADANTSAVVWRSANAAGRLTSPVAQLLDTGNLVVKQDGDGSGTAYAWQGFDHPTDTMLPGMKVGVDNRTGRNSTVTSWRSKSDPSLGTVYAFMDPRGNPEIYIYAGPKKIWRSGAWNGVRLSGSPDTATYQDFSFSFVSNSDEVTYSYVISNKSIVSRLVVTEERVVQRRVWLWESSQWSVYWYAPKDPCDKYGVCGPYGTCDPNNSPVCKCLVSEPAFAPKNPGNWALRDGSQGCVRRTALDCENGTDGFVAVSNLKLPESEDSVVDMGLDLDGCRRKCLMNCSCTAYAAANISGGGSGSGCVVWFSELVDIRSYIDNGQDLYVRVAAADIVPTPEQFRKSKRATVAVTVSLLLGTLLLACVGCFVWRRKKKRRVTLGVTGTSFNDKSNAASREHDLDLPLFDFDTILASTNQFSEENKLGEGGFGPVYKGTLENGQELGVKRLSRTSTQGLEEFKNEVVLIAKLQHRNLVRLLGCCIQGEERMLIYEYMPNKSLDFFLFEKGKGALLDWQTRYQVILGIARGLLYLHQDSRLRIIHRDLKASNILLDKEMNPKISDFGMARIFGGDETDFNTIKVVGTYGYMSPEYAMDGVFSVKSDVFSFGVLVLEVVSGKKNRGVYSHSHHVNLLSHAWSLWREGKSMQLVDELIGYSYPMDEVLRCIKIGLLCVQERPEDRPLMSSVILMLSSDIASLPQPKQPGFAARRGPFETESSTSNQDSSGVNDITVTMLQGR